MKLIEGELYHIRFIGSEELTQYYGKRPSENGSEYLFKTLACTGLPEDRIRNKSFLNKGSWHIPWSLNVSELISSGGTIKRVTKKDLPLYIGYDAVSPLLAEIIKNT